MRNVNIETPDWLRQMESILEELNEGVAILDDQLRVIFANEALSTIMAVRARGIAGPCTRRDFPSEDIPNIMRAA